MFIDPNRPERAPEPAAPHSAEYATPPARKEMIIAVIAAVVIALGGGAWWWFYGRAGNETVETPPVIETPLTGLPSTLEPSEGTGNGNGFETDPDLRGENVTFGAFYKSLNEPLEIKAPAVALPLNVKSDVSNYYDVARKINLDPVISNLNQDGFAVLDNPFGEAAADFFGAYRQLAERDIPTLVTSDFLAYYYQNSFKQLYKDIESSFFYDSLWKINKQLFDAANGRYQERRQAVGLANDPLLEAQRLEAAYFAASLALLSPTPEQINPTEELTDSSRFKPSEAARYEFSVPAYLTEDLARELQLIREARTTAKSPLLLYERDYRDFAIPSAYADSAKLRNFYAASRWQTSLFPLNFRGGDCGDCLLDREDWIINQTAAHLIAADMSSSQALKNEWAKIYKVISFFMGLRSELTYLHYDEARRELFPDRSLDDIFGSETFERLSALRDRLLKYEFRPAEGALSRQSPGDRPYIGMRLLQTFYWPSRHVYNQLTYDPAGLHAQPRDARGNDLRYLSSCGERGELYRCRGIGYDVINLIADDQPTSKFLLDNMNYTNYQARADGLKAELARFDQNNWHGNNFWATLYAAEALIDEDMPVLPYTRSSRWQERKVSTALAAMANLELGADEWQIARSGPAAGLETSGSLATLGYVEPNARAADELVANATMLFQTLVSLGVVKDNDVRFTDLVTKLSAGRTLIRKELSAEPLVLEDYQFISDLVGQFTVTKAAEKTAAVDFFDAAVNRRLTLRQSVSPMRFLVLIYEKDGQKVLAVGPVFSYKEE